MRLGRGRGGARVMQHGRVTAARPDSARLGSAPLGCGWLRSARLGPAAGGSARLSSARLRAAPAAAARPRRCGATRARSTCDTTGLFFNCARSIPFTQAPCWLSASVISRSRLSFPPSSFSLSPPFFSSSIFFSFPARCSPPSQCVLPQ